MATDEEIEDAEEELSEEEAEELSEEESREFRECMKSLCQEVEEAPTREAKIAALKRHYGDYVGEQAAAYFLDGATGGCVDPSRILADDVVT